MPKFCEAKGGQCDELRHTKARAWDAERENERLQSRLEESRRQQYSMAHDLEMARDAEQQALSRVGAYQRLHEAVKRWLAGGLVMDGDTYEDVVAVNRELTALEGGHSLTPEANSKSRLKRLAVQRGAQDGEGQKPCGCKYWSASRCAGSEKLACACPCHPS